MIAQKKVITYETINVELDQRLSIGQRIVQIRTALGLTPTEFAGKCGILGPSLSRVENRTTSVPSVDTLKKIMRYCKQYGLTWTELIGEPDGGAEDGKTQV